ncbi:MAG: bifunctional serine/threonine-protein kinase/formylglycine-generating enzyme family protein [Polyangiaceae bacterium]
MRDPLNIVGQTVADKYVVERMVGEGGFAVVYRAMHTIWKKPVAIKFFSELSSAPQDQRESLQEAFIQEGALLTELSSQSAGIVQARDVGTYTTPEGRWMPFMVLEWLEGRSLEDAILDTQARGPWSLNETLLVIAPAAMALDVAHGQGIAHRDVKPANIFILGEDPRGPEITVKLLDFGVAKMITDNTQMQAALAKTGTNITSFTPQYGAPEQFSRSYGATGPWTDVFALALVAVELLAGKPALDGGDLIQLAYSSGNKESRPTPRTLGIAVPDEVEAVFRRALDVSPEARFARAGDFMRAMQDATGRLSLTQLTGRGSLPSAPMELARTMAATPVLPGPATTSTPSTFDPTSEKKTGRGALLAVGGLLGVAAIGAGVFVLRGSGSNNDTTAAAPSGTPAVMPEPSASGKPPSTCPADMVKIPGGEFFMGSDDSAAADNEKPAHNVKLSAYCIDKTEVTRKAYLACSSKGACPRAGREARWPDISDKDKEAWSPLCNEGAEDRNDHPINCVTHRDASTYCAKQGKRLPTEAEWEYATRGPDGRIYPWGDEQPTSAHLNSCDKECAGWAQKSGATVRVLFPKESDGYASTAPVGSFTGGDSRFGPKDVVGNVWEWVADFEGPYKANASTNPKGPDSGTRRVIRGGGFDSGSTSWLRPSFRYGADPENRSPTIGFRCAQPLGE